MMHYLKINYPNLYFTYMGPNSLSSLGFSETLEGRYCYEEWKKEGMRAVTLNPDAALQSKYEGWYKDYEIVFTAVGIHPFSLRHAQNYNDDEGIVKCAIQINGLALTWASDRLQNHPEFKRIALKNIPRSLPKDRWKRIIRWDTSYKDDNIYYTDNHCNYLNKVSYFNKAVYATKARKENSKFFRDSSVTLFGGKRLLPYSFKNPLYQGTLKASLPSSANHFLLYKRALSGKGFMKNNVEQAMINAIDFDIPFQMGKTCIEGGNCFLFDKNGERKAVVGELSLILSLIALEEQGYFEGKLTDIDGEPSMEAYRIARNRDLYATTRLPIEEKKRKIDSESNQQKKSVYYKSFTNPVTQDEKLKFQKEAEIIEKKLELTRACIALELEVPLKNIAFLPQLDFHIDMEMFVTPLSEIVLNSDHKVREFLDKLSFPEMNEGEKALFECYKKNAEKRAQVAELFSKEREILLKNAGIPFTTIPAIFKGAKFQSALNYCNGIFTLMGAEVRFVDSKNQGFGEGFDGVMKKSGFHFITTGPSFPEEERLHGKFNELFEKTFPKIKMKGIPNLSRFVAEQSGGIHCLTFENYLVTDLSQR